MAEKINVIKKTMVLVFFAMLVSTTTAADKILYVDADAVGANDGSNWENAYLCLQDALEYAIEDAFAYAFEEDFEGDLIEAQVDYEIRVANGIYKPDRRTSVGSDGTLLITSSGDWTDTFFISDMTIRGGYAGYGEPDPNARYIDLYETILSGDLYGNDVNISNPEDLREEPSRAENSFHVVIGSGSSVIDGLTITGGNANAPPQSSYSRNDSGGGLWISGSWSDTLHITNCTFTGNSALSGGGGIYKRYGNLILTNCNFTGNQAGNGGGGGIYAQHGDLNLTSCTITGNQAGSGGGGIDANNCTLNLTNCKFIKNTALRGGGIFHNEDSWTTMINCTFIENSARAGGGLYNEASSPTLTNCVFRGNSVSDQGGGMYSVNRSRSGESPILRNCLFTGNHSGFRGGGIYNLSCEPVLTNCTFAGNWAGEGSALYCKSEHERNTITLTNCILWNFGNEIWNNDLSIINVSYSNIQGGWFGEGNIDEDPLFVDQLGPDHIPGTEDDDLRLDPVSPCVNAGDPNYIPEPNETDIDGNPRVTSGRVDMGAYESQGVVIYVDTDAPGANDGSSWENAFHYLQDALADASDNDEIRVAQGVYKPDQGANQTPGDWTATFELINGIGVTIRGGYAGHGKPDPDARDIDLYETILSGDLYDNDVDVNDPEDMYREPTRSENSYHVLSGSGFAVIDGLTITGGNANDSSHSDGNGGGMRSGDPAQISNCTFMKNSAIFSGGAIYSYGSTGSLINCIFTRNFAGTGGGGGIHYRRGSPSLTNCTFIGNSTFNEGGGMSNDESYPTLTNCTFIQNSADSHGGGMYNRYSSPILTSCTFIGNTGSSGGGINNFNRSQNNPTLRNCLFVRNRAYYGGGIENYSGEPVLTNCTFAWNSAEEGNALYCRAQHGRNTVRLFNCILWDGGDEIWNSELTIMNIFYSNIQGGWFGEGNIDEDPLFADPNGPDRIPGTEDDDLRLSPLSPCVDSGDPNYVSMPNETDIEGNPRVVGGRVDMGAYESQYIIYVDDDAPGDSGPGDILISDPLENGTESHPMDSIQEAIDMAEDRCIVIVQGGVYNEPIDFKGKAITVTSGSEVAVLETPGDYAVSFLSAEGPDSILKNFVIRNSLAAVFIPGSSPTIRNLTAVNNEYGITAYTWAEPDISNCIFWNNSEADLFQCEARYSCIEDGGQGQGNISADPLFVDAENGDYHLRSQGWCWSTKTKSWTYDDYATSPCIDTGDPACPLGDEPMSVPRDPDNEYGINLYINMGAYGGTCQASIPPLNWIPKFDNDPPIPNPAQWAPNGEPREVYGGGGTFDYRVEMTAAETTDASGGPVEYFFECTTEHGFSSGWLSTRNYVVLVGRTGQRHRFRVKARDQFGNETAWSELLSAE